MRKNVQFHWDAEQQDAFDKLKTALTSAPVLGTVRSESTLYLDTDASDLGLGIVLSQDQDGEERVLAYASRTLTAPERVYSVTRKRIVSRGVWAKALPSVSDRSEIYYS